MSQRYFCPAEYTLSQNIKLTLNLVLFFRVRASLGLELVFWLVLGFVLVVYYAGQKYRWFIFLLVPVVT